MFDLSALADALQSPVESVSIENILAGLLNLVVATAIGLVVTAVRKRNHGRPLPLPIEQTMMMLSFTGALMVIMIGNSLPRALGIAGAAALIRFRTPVEDPRDTTLFLILLGLGMTSGVGAFAIAGSSAALVCLLLIAMNYHGMHAPRQLELDLVSATTIFPASKIEKILSQYALDFRLQEMSVNEFSGAKYQVNLPHQAELRRLTDQLLFATGSELRSVSWNEKKWMRQ